MSSENRERQSAESAPRQETLDPASERAETLTAEVAPAIMAQQLVSARARSIRPADVLALHRSVGNRAVQGLLDRRANHFGPRDANGVAEGAEASVDRAASSIGEPLPNAVLEPFERSLGTELSGVRVHTGSESAEAAEAVGAKAYTVGQDIHFGAGYFAPAHSDGVHLLAHEVAHTVQSRGGGDPTRHTKLEVSTSADSAEIEADRVADALVAGASSGIGGATVAVQQGGSNMDSRVSGPLQRKMGDGHDLTSPRFAGEPVLEACYDGEHLMTFGEPDSAAVAAIQQALIDLGHPLPISTKKSGSPDGIYGGETAGAVARFKADSGITPSDGVLGPKTMARLDQLFSGGTTPDRKKPEIDATEEAVGKYTAEKMKEANVGPQTADEGIWYARNYRAAFPDRWKEDYMSGFANPQFFVRVGFMDWVLKPGVSASEAIKAWLKGLTIAECYTTIVAIEYDTLRATVSDDKFDQTFGSPAVSLPPNKLLHIAPPPVVIPLEDYMKATPAASAGDVGTLNNRPAKVGEWYYFSNHPKYLLKHPAGEWQGENSIYRGRDADGNQLWEGLGTATPGGVVGPVTESQMLDEMVSAYNGARDNDDNRELDNIKASSGGVLPKQYVFDDEGGELPRTITKDRILNDPPIAGTSRQGGFMVTAGQTLDLDKLKNLRNAN